MRFSKKLKLSEGIVVVRFAFLMGLLEMPLFEYHCADCDHRFELLMRFEDAAVCPQCDSQKPDRLLSAPATHTKGNGSLPIAAAGCPPAEAPPCHPRCCRLP